MWNQNNGNGQGNGYPQQPQYGQPPMNVGGSGMGAYVGGDTYDRLNNARDVGDARFPFIEDGQHRFALVSLEEQQTKDGPRARAILKTISSTNPRHAPGSFVTKMWYLTKPARFPNALTEGEEFVDFVRKLKGAPAGSPMGADMRLLMKERPLDQLARGTVIDVNGVMNKKGNYVKVYWSAVQQAPSDIAAMRQQIEAAGLPATNGGAQPAAAPPQYGQQYAQQQAQQYAPPQAQQVQQMQYAQQAAPPQYTQQQAQQYAPPAAAPVQGPPPGGFLANVPPQGGGWPR